MQIFLENYLITLKYKSNDEKPIQTHSNKELPICSLKIGIIFTSSHYHFQNTKRIRYRLTTASPIKPEIPPETRRKLALQMEYLPTGQYRPINIVTRQD